MNMKPINHHTHSVVYRLFLFKRKSRTKRKLRFEFRLAADLYYRYRPVFQKGTEAVVTGGVDVEYVHSLTRIGQEWGMPKAALPCLPGAR